MTSSHPSRRELTTGDLERLADALRAAKQPHATYDALAAVSGEVIGHRLFTIMRFDAGRAEVERIYSTVEAAYPVGGRKKKKDTDWAQHLLHDMKVFRSTTPDEIRAAFDDHRTILGLGIGSILNVPIVFGQRCLGTMNLCHQTGWYEPADERTGVLLGTFLVPLLLSER